jgi:Glycosyltransferase Family 4
MRFSVDAHAIGCHLTGNEVYIRNLLTYFARLDPDNEFFTYLSKPHVDAEVPSRFHKRQVSQNPFKRLGIDLLVRLRADRPDLLHVQYTSPLSCPVPIVVSVHDVSYLEHPQYFTTMRLRKAKWWSFPTQRLPFSAASNDRWPRPPWKRNSESRDHSC